MYLILQGIPFMECFGDNGLHSSSGGVPYADGWHFAPTVKAQGHHEGAVPPGRQAKRSLR